MEFLNKPMSEIWKSTKQSFSEIMSMNDSNITSATAGRPSQSRDASSTPVPGSTSTTTTTRPTSSQLNESSISTTVTTTTPTSTTTREALGVDSPGRPMANNISNTPLDQETVKPHRQKSHPNITIRSSSKIKRPASEDVLQKSYEDDKLSIPRSSLPDIDNDRSSNLNRSRSVKGNNSHNSFNSLFGRFNFKSNLNASKLSEPTASSSKVLQHSKSKSNVSLNSVARELDLKQVNENPVQSHRTHTQSRSRQGSLSDYSQSHHYRSNSSDRATLLKTNESKVKEKRLYKRSSSDLGATSTEDQEPEEDVDDVSAEKMKTKFMSLWNNVKYGWTVKTKTTFSLAKPIWILGKCFQRRIEVVEENRPPGLDAGKSPAMELFRREFASRIWLTYRREFPQLAGSSYTSDCGWGCMLRSGQMMLAQALIQHFLGKDWNYYNKQSQEELRYHFEITRWFGDHPDEMSPFSVHRLVDIGKASGKKAGDWYGPASVAHIFKEAMGQATDLNPLLEQICIYVAQDCTIYKQDVIDLCKRRQRHSLQPVFKDCTSTTSSTTSSSSPPTHPSAVSDHHQPSSLPTGGCSASPLTESSEATVACEPPCSEITTNGAESVVQYYSSRTAHTVKQSDRNGTVHATTAPSEHLAESTSPTAKSCQNPINVSKEDTGMPVSEAGTSVHGPTGTSGNGRESSSWCAVVILVPVRLGGDEVNPIYVNSLQALFHLDCCIGIIGGRPKHSLYYIGYQEEKLIHLDPHYCQPVVDMRAREFSLSSFHCMSPRKMAIAKMDPSCTVGFYLRTEADFNKFCNIIEEIVYCSDGTSSDYPMFILRDGRCSDWNGQDVENTNSKPERHVRLRHVDQNGKLLSPMKETEDFVFLDT